MHFAGFRLPRHAKDDEPAVHARVVVKRQAVRRESGRFSEAWNGADELRRGKRLPHAAPDGTPDARLGIAANLVDAREEQLQPSDETAGAYSSSVALTRRRRLSLSAERSNAPSRFRAMKRSAVSGAPAALDRLSTA